MCPVSSYPLYPSAQGQTTNHCHPTQSPQCSTPLVMTSTQLLCKAYAKDYLRLSEPTKWLIGKWKTILANRYTGWRTRWQNTSEPTTKYLRDTLKTCSSCISKCPLGQDSIYQSNGSNASTPVTSPAIQLMTACETLHTSYPSTHPCYHQMICQLDLFCYGSTVTVDQLGRRVSSVAQLQVPLSQ
jgi:hypothetical protein